MPSVDTATARKRLADLVNRVFYTKERITLTRYGRACAVLVPVEDLSLLGAGAGPASAPAPQPRKRRTRQR